MSRPSTLLLLFLVTGLSYASLALEPRASPKPGDPSLDGKGYLISEADFRAILAVSRRRIAGHPSYHLRRVHVISRDKVEVYVDDFAHPEYTDPHSLELQLLKKGWSVTAQSLDLDPIID